MWNSIKHFLLKKFWGEVVYMADKLYCFRYEYGELSLIPLDKTDDKRKLICILAREHFFECHQVLPQIPYLEANRLLRNLIPDAPFSGEAIKSLASNSDGWVVNFSVIPKPLYKKIKEDKYRFIIPITWVLKEKESLAIQHLLNQKIIVKNENGFINSISVMSTRKSDLKKFQVWCWGNNISQDIITSSDLPEKTFQPNWRALSASQLMNSFVKGDASSFRVSWTVLGCSVSMVFLTYFILLTIAIKTASYSLDNWQRKIDANISSSLKIKNEYTEKLKKLDSQISLISDFPMTWAAWQGVISIRGVVIKRLIIDGNNVELYGFATSASNVLSQLKITPGVENPDFIEPIKKIRQYESFALTWNAVALPPQNSTELNQQVTEMKINNEETMPNE